MVLLVLKLFVSSRPFELWRCLMYLCFAIPWGTSWIPFCYVFSMLQINKWLSMHNYSWSFVCVSFYVVTWLLSSMVRVTSFMPIFRVLWSQLAILYIDLIKIVLACLLKKFYHLHTWGRAGVKLGDAWYVAKVSIILMLHACFTPIAICFVYTSWLFYAFSGTNLLTRCHSANSCFLLFLCFRKVT
jgi:hypothetical protein